MVRAKRVINSHTAGLYQGSPAPPSTSICIPIEIDGVRALSEAETFNVVTKLGMIPGGDNLRFNDFFAVSQSVYEAALKESPPPRTVLSPYAARIYGLLAGKKTGRWKGGQLALTFVNPNVLPPTPSGSITFSLPELVGTGPAGLRRVPPFAINASQETRINNYSEVMAAYLQAMSQKPVPWNASPQTDTTAQFSSYGPVGDEGPLAATDGIASNYIDPSSQRVLAMLRLGTPLSYSQNVTLFNPATHRSTAAYHLVGGGRQTDRLCICSLDVNEIMLFFMGIYLGVSSKRSPTYTVPDWLNPDVTPSPQVSLLNFVLIHMYFIVNFASRIHGYATEGPPGVDILAGGVQAPHGNRAQDTAILMPHPFVEYLRSVAPVAVPYKDEYGIPSDMVYIPSFYGVSADIVDTCRNILMGLGNTVLEDVPPDFNVVTLTDTGGKMSLAFDTNSEFYQKMSEYQTDLALMTPYLRAGPGMASYESDPETSLLLSARIRIPSFALTRLQKQLSVTEDAAEATRLKNLIAYMQPKPSPVVPIMKGIKAGATIAGVIHQATRPSYKQSLLQGLPLPNIFMNFKSSDTNAAQLAERRRILYHFGSQQPNSAVVDVLITAVNLGYQYATNPANPVPDSPLRAMWESRTKQGKGGFYKDPDEMLDDATRMTSKLITAAGQTVRDIDRMVKDSTHPEVARARRDKKTAKINAKSDAQTERIREKAKGKRSGKKP